MKPADFYKIMADFVKEDKYWRALQIGDTVYDEVPRGFENDYHKAVIKEVNVDERFIVVDDLSVTPVQQKKYHSFITQEEFDKL